VDEAVVFGDGRPKLGLLVFGSKDAKGMPADEVVRRICVPVEEANQRNKPWTRVDRDVVVVVPYGTS
jgi:hypothetical protein